MEAHHERFGDCGPETLGIFVHVVLASTDIYLYVACPRSMEAEVSAALGVEPWIVAARDIGGGSNGGCSIRCGRLILKLPPVEVEQLGTLESLEYKVYIVRAAYSLHLVGC